MPILAAMVDEKGAGGTDEKAFNAEGRSQRAP